MIAAALLGRRGIGLKQLALNELGIEMTELSDLIGTGRSQISMADVSIERAAEYAAADAGPDVATPATLRTGARSQELDPGHDGSGKCLFFRCSCVCRRAACPWMFNS